MKLTEVRDLVIHLRLPCQFVIFFIFLTGFIMAGHEDIGSFIFGAVIFLLFVSGGTVAFNSYYDKDKGPINFLKEPPKPTKSLLWLSSSFKAIGVLLGLLINVQFFVICLVCVLMSVLYSYPRFKLKAKYGVGTVINGFGYGSLNALAGWFTSTPELNGKALFLFLITFFLVMAADIITQIFQYEEDRKRWKNMVVIFGPRMSLLIAEIFMLIVLGLLNVFFLLHYSLIHNIIMSAIILAGMVFLYHWHKNFEKVDHCNFWKYGVAIFIFGAVILNLLLLNRNF